MYRDVFEQDDVSRTIDASIQKYSRLGDAWEGLKWLLARKPDVGMPIGDGLYLHKQGAWPNTPNITVLYSYNDERVTIKGAKLSSKGENVELQNVEQRRTKETVG